jgi:hypothetical protein
MPSRQPIPRPGDLLNYRRQRDLVRELHAARAVRGEGAIQTDLTATGSFLSFPRAPVMALFEIVDSACDWRREERSSSGWPYQWHYTIGRPILYYRPDGTWSTPTPPTDADSSSSSSGILDEYITHPTGYAADLAVDQRLHDAFWPLYSVGDWVWCIYDSESGLWAIHDGYESWFRFELVENLPTGRSAAAYLLRCSDCPESGETSSSSSGICWTAASGDECDEAYTPITDFTFRVHDALCGWEGHEGQRGYCKFFAESRRFEVIALSNRTFWRIELAEDLDQWATEPVLAYRRCWHPAGNGGYGEYLTDCEQTILIADWSEIGYFGYASEGATGTVELHQSDNGRVGVLTDLRCPVECICGESNIDPACYSSSSSSSGA